MLDPQDRSGCPACPRYATGYRCRASNLHRERKTSDILWLYTQPEPVDIPEEGTTKEPGISGATNSVMQTALMAVYRQRPELIKYHIRKSYAAQCVPAVPDEKPSKRVLDTCHPLVMSVIEETQPKLIVAFGASVLKQLGIKSSHTDVRGRILEPEHTGLSAPLLVTFSERAITGFPGIFETFKQDLRNGFARMERGTSTDTTLEELTKGYVLPSTMDDALALVAKIHATPDTTTLSVDTETTSLRPEKEDTKVIAFCFSWGVGEATTILFDHPHAPPEYLERLPELEAAVRALLASPKPKVLHNAKFDLKWIELKYGIPVNNVVWCTLLGEHLLDEDKKGNYGLKALTAVWMPKYCGYEDKLHDILNATDVDEFDEIDEKIAGLSEEHKGYSDALEGYKDELARYREKKQAYDALQELYQANMELYEAQRAKHKADVAAYEALSKKPRKPEKPKAPKGALVTDADFQAYGEAMRVYDAAMALYEAWEAPPKPVKDFSRPEKPAALERAPEEPKDPRSRKERDYNTDAGFEKVPLPELQLYGGVDADVTRRLSSIQLTRLAEEAQAAGVKVSPCRALMRTHAIPASRVLGEMEFRGTSIDQAYIPVLEKNLTDVIDKATEELVAMAPGIKLSSAKELAVMLYETGWTHPDGGHMPPVTCLAMTKKGARSTAEGALRPYMTYDVTYENKKEVKIPKRECYFLHTYFLWRKALKARDTFLMNLRVLSKRDGRIHTSFHINGTGTGRLSSSDMNLQNIPKQLGGFNIKKLFIPDHPDMLFVNADYKGAEVRVFTAYAPDAALIKALNDGLDMHSFFASKVHNRPYQDYEDRDNKDSHLSEDYRKLLNRERTAIKRTVFGILYGAGPSKIAETIGMTLQDGQALIELLFNMFPAIRDYLDEVKFLVARDGYVETLFGRRRRFPLQATSRHRSRAERQACNFKIQSTSSDIVISQLLEIHNAIHSDKTWPEFGIHKPLHTYGVRLLLTVHDSIGLQWPKKLLPALEPWLTYYGETRVREKYSWLPVPFKMDIEVGPSYGECMPVAKYLAGLPPEFFDEGVTEERELLNELRADAFEA